jgi:hypothetical protein
MSTYLSIRMKNSEGRNEMLLQALRLAKMPIIIAMFVTPVRFFLELAGLPENAIFIIGLLWLTLAFSIYWGIKLYNEKNPYLIHLLSLIIFSPISRLLVSVLWWIDTRWEIGTHYSLYFDNFAQAALNQVVYGSLIQIIPGFLLGSLTIAIMQYRKSVKK